MTFYASPGFVAETMTIFLARGLRAGTAQPEDDEVIEIHLMPSGGSGAMVIAGRIRDAKTIPGFCGSPIKKGVNNRVDKGFPVLTAYLSRRTIGQDC